MSSINKLEIKKSLDNMNPGSYSESDLIEETNEWIKWFESLPPKLKLYRILQVDDKKDINFEQLGSHYSDAKKDLIDNHSFAVGYGKNHFLVTILVDKSQVNPTETIVNRILYPYENEITLKNKGKNIDVVSVKKIKDDDDYLPKKLKKRNNESLTLIKTLGQVISEWKSFDEIEEDNKFIEDYERNLELAKKITPKIIELLKITLKNEIKKIDYHTKKVIMGSTYDEKNKESYSAKRIEIVIQSDNPDKDRWIDQQIYNKVNKLLKDYTPFNPKKYGSPIDILVT